MKKVKFFCKAKYSQSHGLTSLILHSITYHTHTKTHFNSKYRDYSHQAPNSLGLEFLYQTEVQKFLSLSQTISIIKQRLKDRYIQSRNTTLHTITKYRFFRIMNNDFQIAPYLTLLPLKTIIVKKFRLSNYKLPIERGR